MRAPSLSGPSSPRIKRREQIAKKAEAALNNEGVTRSRVDVLEGSVAVLVDYAEKTELLAQELADWRAKSSLWGRLRWLFTGR